ncbi:MAG: hypothetical protein OXH49_08440 [Gemmatimonadetes bacterium]|nr:hypothetical protein [Gemmatimonadota bacterium]
MMLEQLLTGEGLATTGLFLDMIGVIMLFYYGMPPRMRTPKEWEGKLFIGNPYSLIVSPVGSDTEAGEEHAVQLRKLKRRYGILSYSAIALVVLGFGLQIVAITCY